MNAQVMLFLSRGFGKEDRRCQQINSAASRLADRRKARYLPLRLRIGNIEDTVNEVYTKRKR